MAMDRSETHAAGKTNILYIRVISLFDFDSMHCLCTKLHAALNAVRNSHTDYSCYDIGLYM